MISEFTLQQLGDAFAVRELSRVRVVGRREPVRVFEPMTRERCDAAAAVLTQFQTGLQAYYAGEFETAAGVFAEIADDDAPAARYVAKCRTLMEHPPATWDGVWEMTEK